MKSKKRIKVAEVIDHSFLGGGQRHILSLASRINKDVFDLLVCSSPGGPLVAQLKEAGVAHHGVFIRKKNPRRSYRELKTFFSQEEFDIVHTHGGVAGLAGRWAAYQAGVPVIIHTLHGIHYLHYRNPVLKWLMVWQERLMSRWTDNIICVSFADARLVSRYRLAERSKIVVIRNGLEWPSRVLLSPEMKREKKIKVAQLLGVDPDFYFVGTVARLHRQKGLIYFFRSFPEVKRKINQVVFLVIGGGPLERKFSRYLRQKRWEKRIFLLGERRDVADFYPVFDLFVLPSLWEGLPLALLEAAQWELPVVATDIDGCREVITSGKTGLLVAPGKVKALAEAIIWVREHPAEAQLWGQALAHEVSQRFTLREMVTQLEELYLSLVRKN